jgi:phage-related protein
MKEMTEQGKEIFNLLKTGKGFSNPLITGAAVLGGTVAASTSLVSSISSVTDPTMQEKLVAAGLTTVLLNSFTTSLTSTTATTKTLTDYGQKSIDEFSSRMQEVAKGYSNVMGAAGEQVGCTPFSGIMGVATEYGQKAIDTINSTLESVNDVLSDLQDAIDKGLDTVSDLANQAVSKINEGISKITAYADEVVQMIEEEAALIAEYLKTNINGFLAGILPDWFDDACKTGVIDTIATPEMKSALQK